MADKQLQEIITPPRVLVLDDEEDIRRLFCTSLAVSGCIVESSSNARHALRTLMQQPFDVLVVDLRMEDMDGIVFLQEALKVWPWLGVIIVSGYLDEQAKARAAEMGIRRLYEKPVDIDVLCRSVTEEAQERQAACRDIPRGNAIALMRDHLKLLDRLDGSSVSSEKLILTLVEFGRTLGGMIPSSVVGVLIHGDAEVEREMMLYAEKPVSEQYLKSVEQEMLRRFNLLGEASLSADSVRVERAGELPLPDHPSEIKSSVSIPIIQGEAFCGLLTLTSSEEGAYSTADTSLLYHAANQISAVFSALRRMHALATRDPLTGAYNRIRLEEELNRTWMLTRRYNGSMSAVIIDIDNFKTLNDSFGHSVGDILIRNIAGLIRGAARATDVVARYGGDEFVAILPQARDRDARAFGERVIRQLRETVFCPDSHRIRVSASIGIASTASTVPPGTADELLQQADRALFLAKRAGRDRLAVWPEQTYPPEHEAPSAPAPRTDCILVVDDDSAILDLIAAMLGKKGYTVTCCRSAWEALALIQESPAHFDVLLTDLSMPGKSGVDLLREVGAVDPGIVKIVMTGFATVDTAVDCLREGAYDFIQKPVRLGEMTALIRRALEYRYLKIENSRYQAHLEEMVRQRSAQLSDTLEQVRLSHQFTLEALVAMLDAREQQTAKHSVRTRELAVTLARRMGVSGEDLDAIATGAFLHDIGKIAVPDAILIKPGPLLPHEWEVMRTHAETGYRILTTNPLLRKAAEIVYSHHEHFDGSGYPRKLKGREICLGARIFSVIDAYDAMRSDRVYRKAYSREKAMAEIVRNSGSQFDPTIVDAFLVALEEIERILATPEPAPEPRAADIPAIGR